MATGRMSGGPTPLSTIPRPATTTTSTIPGSTGRMPISAAPVAARMPAPEPAQDIPWNPISFVAGLATNLGKGVVDTVKGLGQLFLVAPVHDAIQLGANLYPGHQSIEDDPSTLATVARTALPGAWVPGPDLGGKWGAIASDFANRYGSPSKLAHGLYENPLAYIMDALVVADGVGLVAKAGRVGRLSALPELVSDATAGKILGPALHAETGLGLAPKAGEEWAGLARYGDYPYASFSRNAGTYEQVGLSKNFLTRGVQKSIFKGLSDTPEEALVRVSGLNTELGGPTVRQAQVIADANKFNSLLSADALYSQPMRIFKPKVGEFVAQHSQSRVLSALRIRLQSSYQATVDELRPHILAKDIDEVTGLERAVDEHLPFRYDQALDAPEVLPKTDPYTIEIKNAMPISPKEAEVLGETIAPFKPETLKYMVDRYGENGSVLAYENPYARSVGGNLSPGNPGSESYAIVADRAEDFERVGKEALEAAGYKYEHKAMETLSGADHPWEQFSMYGKNEAGEVMHVSVGTRELIEAQRNAGPIWTRLQKAVAEEGRLLEEFKAAGDDVRKVAVTTDKLKLNIIEQRAIREFLKSEHFIHSRAMHWADEIADPLTGAKFGYNPELKQAWSTRPWRTKHVIERWMAESGDPYPFTTMMERKYVLPRAERLIKVLGDLRPQVEEIAGRPALPRLGDAAKHTELSQYLKQMGVPEDIVRRVLDSGRPGVTQIPSGKAIMERLKNTLYDYTIKEGGAGGGYDMHPWDWRTMQDELLSAGKPVPTYLPNLPRAKPSEYMMKGGVGLETKQGIFAKDWNEELFGKGQLTEVNMADALVRASKIVTTHDEMRSFMDKMIKEFGRNSTREEATAWLEHGDMRYAGEYFFDPEAALNMVDLRGELLSKTILNVPEAADVLEATKIALDDWSNKVATSALNNATKGSVKAIPEHVAKMMQREMQYQLGNSIKVFWDTPMKVWKASVLSLSPRWVLNNVFGNLVFVGLENPSALKHVISQFDSRNRALAEGLLGVDAIRDVESGFWHEMENIKGGLEWEASVEGKPQLAKFKEAAMGGGISTERSAWQNIAHPATLEGTEDARFAKTVTKMNAPSRALQTWSRGVRNMNSHVEEAFRRGILIDEMSRQRLTSFNGLLESSTKTMEKIASEGVPRSAREYGSALERVDRVIGNFTRYSPVEQGIIRRFFMPFYGFYRHMVNVLLKMPIEHPIKSSIFQQVSQMDQIMKAGVPSYLQEDLPVHLGNILGGDTWLRLKNLNPLSQVTEEFGAVNLLNPPLKMLIERGLGINTFTGETFDPESVGQGDDIVQTNNGEFWKVIRDAEGNVLDVERTGRPLPSMLQHVGSQLGLVSMLPSFSLYPKSVERNIASWAGLSTSQPKNGTESALSYDQEMKHEAFARAIGSSTSGFGSMGSFSSFGSF